MSQEQKVLTAKDIQNELRLSRSLTYTLINQNKFPVVRIGKKLIRIPADGFYEWLNNESKFQQGQGKTE